MIEYHLSLTERYAVQWRDIEVERYRSGHNEAVLKTVCPQGRVGSNPTLSVSENEIQDLRIYIRYLNQAVEKYPRG